MRTDVPVPVRLKDYTPYPFEIETVDLDFDLYPDATLVKSVLKVRRKPGTTGDMVLDGEQLALKAISLNGDDLGQRQYEVTETHLTLFDPPERFTLEIEAEIVPSKNTALSGLYMSGGRFCTQCEAEGFRRITYWPDRPDVMSRFRVTMTADRATYPILLSNGSPEPVDADVDDGPRHSAVWDDPHPKPSYLFALCAGDYDVFSDSFITMGGRKVELAIHVDKGEAPRAAWAMDCLKRAMRWDEEVFGREYDLDIFNIVAVRDFNFGAMENKGLNIFNSAYVLADEETATDADFEAIESIVAHEYFHNWTGNRITCRDWFQLCLKEGLTVFRDQEFSADMRSRPVQRIKDVIRLRARQFPEDAGPLAHAVRPSEYGSIDNLYTATVYEKGAELIRMLKTLIGDEAFARGMTIYFERFDGCAATIEDFYSCFEEASGQSLETFRLWYSQPGTPEILVSSRWDPGAGEVTLNLRQSTPPTPCQTDKKPLTLPLSVSVLDARGKVIAEQTKVLSSNTHQLILSTGGQTSAPRLSINRNFSAPVTIRIGDDSELSLAALDSDPFNQWDALQQQYISCLLDLADGHQAAVSGVVDNAEQAVRRVADTDPAYAALLLRLPETGVLMARQSPAYPVQLEAARRTLRRALAEQLSDFCSDILDAAQLVPFSPDAAQAGRRALRAAAIELVAAREDEARLAALFDKATNMTESLATLRALATIRGAARTSALEHFHKRWAGNPLVLDKWFAAQATSTDVAGLKALLAHPDFDMKNPNRVRAAAGVFAMQNLSAFHQPDGRGYLVIGEVASEIDPINPALAARLLTAFEPWRSLEDQAKSSAQEVLRQLQERGLSKNAQDIVLRILG